ncbi:protein of unknown function [Magnetospirillum gryphiswaldense MSR-1 v2]|uniref:Uncharacterized protein n=1 Tax=Magnetospirillum gryphiswaldense (strain DSM 6361 / JCM 21280 / NBRC 15271 / MSR-1) TaxID=431944 RepID=V6F542_MAGGM|nr:hypothetical protein [Magnetospirillum gryphiswaldense]CDL00635.1 protein of unknown function [Magnetospirillum gryphiswaldense MSR-1 v2]
MKPHSLTDRPATLNSRYNRLALVSSPRHLALLNKEDADTLVVICDWLLWQSAVTDGWHCVHFETALIDNHAPDPLDMDIMLRANDWVWLDGVDHTLFHGVSLGRQFCSTAQYIVSAYYRMDLALRKLLSEFSCREVTLYDYWVDRYLVSPDLRHLIVATVARDMGVHFDDQLDPVLPGDPALAAAPSTLGAPPTGWHKLAKQCGLALHGYAMTVMVAVQRRLRPRVNRPLVIANWNMVRSFLQSDPADDCQPMVLAPTLPKTLNLLRRFWSANILPCPYPSVGLTQQEREQIAAMVKVYEAHWSEPAEGLEEAMRRFMRASVLTLDNLLPLARQVKSVQAFLRRYRPSRIVVDGVKSPPLSIFLELGKAQGIPADYIWHSPLAPQNIRFDNLGCESRQEALVERCLSWGKFNDMWLERIGAACSSVRVGNPVLAKYTAMKKSGGGRDVALLLQLVPAFSDVRGLYLSQYEFFVEGVRQLNQLGYKRVIFKMHPSMWREEYYEEIARRFELKVEIRKHGRFEDYVREADLVVGPMVSGAMLEVLASGTPMVAYFLKPSTLDSTYFDGLNVQSDISRLGEAVTNNEFLDPAVVLDLYCDSECGQSPAERFWQALSRSPL